MKGINPWFLMVNPVAALATACIMAPLQLMADMAAGKVEPAKQEWKK